jgi:hypothetical protein
MSGQCDSKKKVFFLGPNLVKIKRLSADFGEWSRAAAFATPERWPYFP